MNALSAQFASLRSRGQRALIPFVTAGDPALDQLPAILNALAEAGADAIEVGVPFSDPIADGPTIQASSQRALDRGVTPAGVFSAITEAQCPVPVILMGYYNTLLRWGLDRYAEAAAVAGVSGTIVCDLTPDEADPWVAASHAHGLTNIFLAAPTSTDARLDEVVKRGSGFVYAISRTGVTGAGSDQTVPPEVATLVNRLRARTDLPICVGFGISQPDHVAMVCRAADGAVVGSWLVDLLAQEWNGGAGREVIVASVRRLKDATVVTAPS